MSRDGLRNIGVCFHFDLPEQDGDLIEFLRTNAGNKSGAIPQPDGTQVFVRQQIEVDDTTAHFHLEVLAEIGSPPPHGNDDVDEILNVPTILSGRELSASAFGRRTIHRVELPSKGIIATLLDAATTIGGYELTLNGANLEVTGDGPLFSFRWSSPSKDDVIVEVASYSGFSIDEDTLLKAAEAVDEGIRLLALEKPKKTAQNGNGS